MHADKRNHTVIGKAETRYKERGSSLRGSIFETVKVLNFD